MLRITANDGVGGIATSGLGGRSFTKGIATAVTVAAPRAAMADACATAVANAVYTPHPTIKLEFAKNIDPDSDIGEHQVVCGVDDLPPEVVEKSVVTWLSIRANVLFTVVILAEQRSLFTIAA